MSDLEHRQKLLRETKIEARALQVLIQARRLLKRNEWFYGSSSKGMFSDNAMCAQMAIYAAKGKEIRSSKVLEKAKSLVLAEANLPYEKRRWANIPLWNDGQKYKKDVLKVFDQTITKLEEKCSFTLGERA